MNRKVLIAIGVIVVIVGAFPLLARLAGDSAPEPPPPKPEIDIWTATIQGAIGIVKQHIAYGTDINATIPTPGVIGTGGTALHIACLTHQHDVMRLLVESGANLEQRAAYPDTGGGTPLHWAVVGVNPVAVEALLEAGANLNPVDNNGATPLDYILVDFGALIETGTLPTLDRANLPPKRQPIYDILTKKGGTHGLM